jgi:hypothetical protein
MLPEFEFLAYKRNCYTFQRLRRVADITVYEALHIVFSLKDGGFACSIASRLNATLIFANAYKGGFINPYKDMKVLKYNTGTIPAEEAYYFHNGHLATTTNTIKEIFNDYKNCGLPFLDKQYDRMQLHPIVTTEINYVKVLNVDKPSLQKEIYNFGYIISNIKHPLYIDLKEKLQAISCQSIEDRKDIPRIAYDLLEWYFTS